MQQGELGRNPETMRCPECGQEADSQDGSSYYICPACGNEFDRDEVDSSGNYRDEPEGWDEDENP